jgi:hypothetical protein
MKPAASAPFIIALALAGLLGLAFGALNVYRATAGGADSPALDTAAATTSLVLGTIAAAWALAVLRARASKR